MRVRITGIAAQFRKDGIEIHNEFGELIVMGLKSFIKFEDGKIYPSEWFDFSERVETKSEKKQNKYLESIKGVVSDYSFDIESYLKAIFMVLTLCLPFFYFGKMEWHQCLMPAMAIYIFLSFIHKTKKNE